MPVLALDTSDAVGVAILGDDNRVLAMREVTQGRRHAELLAPMIVEVLAEAQVQPDQLDHVAVGTGPAPFTGLRVGLVTAQTIAFAAGIAVYGVSTLDAMAQHAMTGLSLADGAHVLVAMDAKRREVYFARYKVVGTALEVVVPPDVATSREVVAAGHAAGAIVIGAGAQLYRDVFDPVADRIIGPNDAVQPAAIAVAVAQLARVRLAAGMDLPVQPLYLRRPDAQEPAARKRAS